MKTRKKETILYFFYLFYLHFILYYYYLFFVCFFSYYSFVLLFFKLVYSLRLSKKNRTKKITVKWNSITQMGISIYLVILCNIFYPFFSFFHSFILSIYLFFVFFFHSFLFSLFISSSF